jgi:three-Cys-motif partner protein
MSDTSIIKERDPQTKTKHLILERYAAAWAGIIFNGLRREVKDKPGFLHFVYVDAFAYTGRYLRDTDALPGEATPPEPIWGSPVLGIRALDAQVSAALQHGFEIHTTAILCERERKHFAPLRESLEMAGLGSRVRETTDFTSLRRQQIAVVRDDFRSIADAVLRYTAGRKFSLVLLDPYGPEEIPYEIVRSFVAGASARRDVIINFPYQDLHKKTGYIRRSDHTAQRILGHYDALFGDHDWVETYERAVGSIAPGKKGESSAVEEALREHYRKRLQDADPDVAIKDLRLLFPDKERTMFYLFLTTHDPTGALAMNEVLWKADLSQQVSRDHFALASRLRADQQQGQPSLFDEPVGTAAAPRNEPEVDVDALAGDLVRAFAGRTIVYRDLLRSQAQSEYWPKHLLQAVRRARKLRLAEFDRTLTNRTQVRFTETRGKA